MQTGALVRSAIFVGSLFVFAGALSAQNQVSGAPSLASGFSRGTSLSSLVSASGKNDKGLELTLGLSSLYDSNLTQLPDGGESDWILTPEVAAEYQLGNSRWNLGARGKLSYDSYQNRDDFSDTSYLLDFYGGYQSRKLDASFTTGVSSTSGFNRLAANFIEQSSFKNRLEASYRFSRKTSLNANWDQRLTESLTEGYGDTTSGTAAFSALWKATPLISIGPGFRYGIRTGNDNEKFIVVGPTLSLNYKLSTKVMLQSTIGIDDSDSPYSRDDSLLNWSLGLNYRASSLWGFDLESIQDTRATLSTGGGFDEISSFRLSYWRKVRRARIQLGVAYEDRSATDSQPTLTIPRDFEYLTLSAAMSLPVFRDRADLKIHVKWRNQDDPDDNSSWEGIQTGLNLTWRF
jgi:hypothetical protein